MLYVANGRDGTVTRLDPGSGRALGAPLPGGEAPWQLAVGPGGTLLVLPVSPRPGVRLTYVTSEPRARGAGQARPVPLESGARAPLLAGAGRYAAVAYQAGDIPVGQSPRRCRLVPVDLTTGRPGAVRDVCHGPETVVGLAVAPGAASGGDDPTGPLAYVALWRRPGEAAACGGATGSRVVALRLATGALEAAAPLAGVPGPLVVAARAGTARSAPVRRRSRPGAGRRGPGPFAHRLPGGQLRGAVRGGAGVAGVGPGRGDPGS